MKKGIKRMSVVVAAAAVTALMLSGCGGSKSQAASALKEGESDLAYVRQKGTFVIGITEFAPMDYRGGGERCVDRL